MNNILERIQDAVSRGEIQNPLIMELCDEISELSDKLNDLLAVGASDEVENYTTGYRNGYRNGQVELLRKILGRPDESIKCEAESDYIGRGRKNASLFTT